jgi:hypothetical protein
MKSPTKATRKPSNTFFYLVSFRTIHGPTVRAFKGTSVGGCLRRAEEAVSCIEVTNIRQVSEAIYRQHKST